VKTPSQTPIIIVRKRKHHAEHHGGAWKVAFADFMTAMFCLFLVLWLINQSSDVKSAIAGYFQDPLGRADQHGSSIIAGDGAQAQSVRSIMDPADVTDLRRTRLENAARNLEEQIAVDPDLEGMRGQVEITLTDEGLRIELLEDASGFFFSKGDAVPSGNAQRIFALLGRELGALALPMRMEGHTDATPYRLKHGYTNWELSADRANAARRIMIQSGLDPSQIVQVRALAERDLKVKDDPTSPRNRRVTILVLLEDKPPAG
jgi:chemotaxis protein MotB